MPSNPNSENGTDLQTTLQRQFESLPPVIKNAITSADVQQHLRDLANTHKLHLDQWQLLENEVMLTLLGLAAPEQLKDNIKSEVGVTDDVAAALAADISNNVFEPIRGELERLLEHPDAQAAAISEVDAARAAASTEEGGEATPATTAPTAPTVQPATPPPAPPETKANRAPVSENYQAGASSSARPSGTDDPYREPPV